MVTLYVYICPLDLVLLALNVMIVLMVWGFFCHVKCRISFYVSVESAGASFAWTVRGGPLNVSTQVYLNG